MFKNIYYLRSIYSYIQTLGISDQEDPVHNLRSMDFSTKSPEPLKTIRKRVWNFQIGHRPRQTIAIEIKIVLI